MTNRRSAAIAIALIAWIAATATAGDYWVSLNGDDGTGDGSAAKPWRTIGHALRTAPQPSAAIRHVIHVGAGVWHADAAEPFPVLVPPGVTIRGAGIDVTTFSGLRTASSSQPRNNGQPIFRCLRATTVASLVPPARITNCTLTNSRSAIEIDGMQRIPRTVVETCRFWSNQIGVTLTNAAATIRACRFDANDTGVSVGRILASPDDTVVEQNRFLGNRYGVNAANALQLVVAYNRFDNNQIGAMLGGVGAITLRPRLHDNTYWRNGQGLLLSSVLGAIIEPHVRHETFWGNVTGIVSLDDTAFNGRSDPDIGNSTVWASSAADLQGVSIVEIHHSNIRTAIGVPYGPIYGINGMMGVDPRHVDPKTGDLHLAPNSPLIDRGTFERTGVPAVDIDAEPRRTGDADIGADEFNGFLVHVRAGAAARDLRLLLHAAADVGRPFFLGASYTADPLRPIHIDRRTIALQPDALFFATFGPYTPVTAFRGTIGAAGKTLVQVRVPDHPLLRGTVVHVAFVTIDPAASSGIATVSNVVRVETDSL